MFKPSLEYLAARDHMMHVVYNFLQPTRLLDMYVVVLLANRFVFVFYFFLLPCLCRNRVIFLASYFVTVFRLHRSIS